MNETLQTENRQLRDEIKCLEHKNEEQEEDIDKYDTSKRKIVTIKLSPCGGLKLDIQIISIFNF